MSQASLGPQSNPPADPAEGGVPDGVDPTTPLRRNRSFARRGDRMPTRHQEAYDELGPRYLIEVPRSQSEGSTGVHPEFRLDAEQAFGRSAPLVVEVGSGSGDAILAGALARPEWNFLALEVWRPGIGHALQKLREHQPDNIRFVEADAAVALATMLAPGSVTEVWTFFPDPWHKSKHKKRRIVNPPFVASVCRLLPPQGLWRLATDWAEYGEHMRRVLDAEPALELDSLERAPLRPMTRFERRGLDAGRQITDLNYRRV